MKRACVVFIICCTLLCSCSINFETRTQEHTDSLSEEEINSVISTEIGDSKAIVNDTADKVIFTDEHFPIMKEGEICGWGQINFIEKLGIWDWYNKMAIQNGVKTSYAINIQIDMSIYLESAEYLSIECQPYLEDNGEITGEPCNVGWSGFGSVAELYVSNKSSTIEVNVQPYTNDLSQSELLRLDFHSADNSIVFDTIYVGRTMLLNAREGANILTITDKKVIGSVNGAQYTIEFSDVFREAHDTYETGSIERGTYWYYDFAYKIKYNSGPLNSKEVLTFDSFSNYSYVVPLKIQVISDVDNTVLNETVYTAQRLLYSDSTDTELYCKPFSGSIPVGGTLKMQNNRMIPASTKTDATYLRFILEFSEEQIARTDDELKDFNGRYTVWQIPIGVRELEEMP